MASHSEESLRLPEYECVAPAINLTEIFACLCFGRCCIRAILDMAYYNHPSDIVSLLLVSKRWTATGFQLLYSDLNVIPRYPMHVNYIPIANTKLHLLHRTLVLDRPSLSTFVTSLKLGCTNRQDWDPARDLLQHLLSRLTNLELVGFPCDLYIVAPRLLSLSIDDSWVHAGSIPFSVSILRILPRLKTLVLRFTTLDHRSPPRPVNHILNSLQTSTFDIKPSPYNALLSLKQVTRLLSFFPASMQYFELNLSARDLDPDDIPRVPSLMMAVGKRLGSQGHLSLKTVLLWKTLGLESYFLAAMCPKLTVLTLVGFPTNQIDRDYLPSSLCAVSILQAQASEPAPFLWPRLAHVFDELPLLRSATLTVLVTTVDGDPRAQTEKTMAEELARDYQNDLRARNVHATFLIEWTTVRGTE